MSFTLDRYGHVYREADTALRNRLDALYGRRPADARGRGGLAASAAPPWASVDPGASENDKSAADGSPTTL